ncbi:RNA-directed DNA polymerase, eukaryota, reverse transcriptase zinc-binding domain protein, partial [Tanacetum coccineum]
GRLSLIKSVLGNLPTYYLSIYSMPITVRNKLESMRNKFFIRGDQEDKKVTWVNWKKCMAIFGLVVFRAYTGLMAASIQLLHIVPCAPLGEPFFILFSALNNKIGIAPLQIKETNGYGLLTDEMVFLLLRLKLNRIPSRVNLDRKGIDIGSILCPNCLEDIETVNHIFFNCGMAQDLWALLAKW